MEAGANRRQFKNLALLALCLALLIVLLASVLPFPSQDACLAGPVAEPPEPWVPAFLIIGGTSCGTTYLHTVLSTSPFLLGTNPKEIYAFADAAGVVEPNVTRFRAALPELQANETCVVFSSPAGELRCKTSGRAMASMWPHLKFVIVLREPIKRALGWYNMCVRQKLSFGLSVEAMLNMEMDMLEEQLRANLSPRQYAAFMLDGGVSELERCLKRRPPHLCTLLPESQALRVMQAHPLTSMVLDGIYAEQVLFWLGEFERDRFHFVKSEELFAQPGDAIREVEKFLGVQRHQYEDEILETPVAVWPDKEQEKGKATVDTLSNKTRARLERFFTPWNARL